MLFVLFAVDALVSSSRLAAATTTRVGAPEACATSSTLDLYDPKVRDESYGSSKLAQYLVDLHDAQGTFDFCGGMMFQLVLSPTLREHLAKAGDVTAYDASKKRMFDIPEYNMGPDADNKVLFHGREVRNVDWAAGGRGFAIHLSLAGESDPEGWTPEEIEGYDGWGHDSGRVWRTGEMLEKEGFDSFRSKFGEKAFTLHHRFYLHLGADNNLWLSAEDGCEGRLFGADAGAGR